MHNRRAIILARHIINATIPLILFEIRYLLKTTAGEIKNQNKKLKNNKTKSKFCETFPLITIIKINIKATSPDIF